MESEVGKMGELAEQQQVVQELDFALDPPVDEAEPLWAWCE